MPVVKGLDQASHAGMGAKFRWEVAPVRYATKRFMQKDEHRCIGLRPWNALQLDLSARNFDELHRCHYVGPA